MAKYTDLKLNDYFIDEYKDICKITERINIDWISVYCFSNNRHFSIPIYSNQNIIILGENKLLDILIK